MNAFTALLAVALLACTVYATPCTEICNGKCALQQKACDFPEIFGKLCGTVNDVCTKSCEAACGCADSCAEECEGEYAICKADGTGVWSMYNCGLDLSVCSASCHLECRFDLFATVVEHISDWSGIGGGDEGSS